MAIAMVVALLTVWSHSAAKAAAPPAFNLDFIPDESQVVFACRPAELVKMKSLASVKAVFEGVGLFEPLSLPLEELEEAKVSVVGSLAGRNDQSSYSVLMLRSQKAHDWTKLGEYFTGPTEQAIVDGQQYFRSTRMGMAGRYSYWLPDDRTILVVPTHAIAKTFTLRGGEGGPAWKAKWDAVTQASAIVMLQRPFYEAFVSQVIAPAGQGPPVPAFGDDVLLLWAQEKAGSVVISGKLDFDSAEEAQAELGRLQKTFDTFQERSKGRLANRPGNADRLIEQLVVQTLTDTKLQTAGATLLSQTPVKFELEQPVGDVVNAARAQAQRQQSTNKMKQIAIALHNYHDVNKRFPAPVTKDANGKPLHSWRLELLPYLGEEAAALYNEFDRNEPWDSEHNKKLIARGAKFFSLPSDKENKYCGYLAITGPGTIFDETAQPMSIRKIIDGTSRTIWFVEAKSKFPWSKPEDLKIDADKELPELGGVQPEGFTASYADGSVQHVPASVNEKTLRALFTRGGREVINTDANGPVNLEE